ncbi:hypothetical protein DVR09_00130 [Erythrobacter aureus]|uniref:Uncharacterized protein n=2 Tax=Erythrobacter aureus TaxID=2182384 RepID=A0A345YAJ2_9SPHN|nr:hypothetical protein DVR09_00130 [Erythrobacter aureus]
MRGASIEDRRLPVNAKARARMYRPIRAVPANPIASLRRRYADLRPDLRERLPAIALTLAFELLLVLALLSLGSVKREVAEMRDSLVAFTAPNTEEDEAEEPAADTPRPSEAVQSQPDLQSSPEPVADRPHTPPAPAPRPILRSDFSLESLPQATSPAQTPSRRATVPPLPLRLVTPREFPGAARTASRSMPHAGIGAL